MSNTVKFVLYPICFVLYLPFILLGIGLSVMKYAMRITDAELSAEQE